MSVLTNMDQMSAPNINILAFKDQQTSSMNKFLDWSLRYGRVIVIVTEFIVIAAFISRFYFDRKLSDLNDHISSEQQFISESQATQNEFLALQQSINEAGSLIDQRHDYSILLQNLSAAEPSGLQLTSFSIQGQAIAFSAVIPSPQALQSFLQNLGATNKFTNISIDEIAIKDGQLNMSGSAQITNSAFQ